MGATKAAENHGYYTADGDSEDPEDPKDRVTFWVIPYWSLVFPLTLLSACLILRKPRQASGLILQSQ